MRTISALVVLLTTQQPVVAQRQWELSDSTSYAVGGDTTLIAARHVLYRALPGDTTVLWDFSDPQEPDRFIRDVDHWSSSDLYVLVGSRYIGHGTTLFKSIDAGATWQVDSSFFDAANEPPSLNQMSIVGDTAYLFNGYYSSEVLRSFDHGDTWQNWFGSLIAHYYGIIPCGAEAFVFGMVGDAFPPSMWQVPEPLWAQQGGIFWSGCHNANAPGCYYSLDITYAAVVHHFDSIATSLCAAGLSLAEPGSTGGLRLVPNPATDQLTVVGLPARATLRVSDLLGRSWPVEHDGGRIELGTLAPGRYQLLVFGPTGRTAMPFVKR